MTAMVLGGVVRLSAQVGADARIEDRLIEITPETREAIDRGLQWLASQQKEDGSWEGGRGANTGVASFAVLSFVSTGVVPERGPYGRTVAKGIDFVISHAQLNGLISNPVDTGHGPMYEHAMSTTMLAEVWGMYHRPKLLDTLQNAVALILSSQNDQGGWRYQPQPSDADISVTVMQVVALRAAKNAGLRVPKSTFDHATTYIKSCAKPNGGFLYQPGTGQENYARTGAGVCSLLTCGDYDSEEAINGIAFLQERKRNMGDEHYHYAMYYAAQAMYLAPDPEQWKQWWPVVRDEMLSQQKKDGHWDGEAGPIYGTGMAILALSVPYRYLPVYQH
jgi:hypothetical protein